jgi:hypothetical protein
MTEGLDLYAVYLQKRLEGDARRVEAVLDVMTKRERQLVREVAVMAHVVGIMRPQGSQVPPDSVVLADVIRRCLSFPDFYPTLNRLERLAIRRASS